jgi:hypothetical protein
MRDLNYLPEMLMVLVQSENDILHTMVDGYFIFVLARNLAFTFSLLSIKGAAVAQAV